MKPTEYGLMTQGETVGLVTMRDGRAFVYTTPETAAIAQRVLAKELGKPLKVVEL